MEFNLGEADRAAQRSSEAGIYSAPAGPASTRCAMEFGTSVSTRAEVFSPKRGSKPSSSDREQLRSMAQPPGAGAAAEHQGAATNTWAAHHSVWNKASKLYHHYQVSKSFPWQDKAEVEIETK